PVVEPAAAPAKKHGNGWCSAEFLLWWAQRAQSPVLLTTGPAQTVTPPGALDDPNTQILVNSDFFRLGSYPGFRLDIGYWFGNDHLWALQLEGFWTGSTGINQPVPLSAASSGVLARPFVNALDGTTAVALVAFPGAFNGSIQFKASSDVYGAEFN